MVKAEIPPSETHLLTAQTTQAPNILHIPNMSPTANIHQRTATYSPEAATSRICSVFAAARHCVSTKPGRKTLFFSWKKAKVFVAFRSLEDTGGWQ